MIEATATVAHRVPGRMRIRLPRDHRHRPLMEQVHAALRAVEGVTGVAVNTGAGSIVVEHDLEKGAMDRVSEVLSRVAGVKLDPGGTASGAPMQRVPGAAKPRVPLAQSIARVATVADRRVYQATDGLLDLHVLVPLALAAVATIEFARTGTGLIPPPHALLWYAASIYIAYDTKRPHAVPIVEGS